MKPIASFVSRHPLASFVMLAYLLSWWMVVPTQGIPLVYGPFFAALIVVALIGGKTGLKDFMRRVFRRGAGAGWYALAAAVPIGVAFTAAGLNLLLGATAPAVIDWSQPLRAVPFRLLFSGMWEEPGWTGFVLPLLLERFARRRHGMWIAVGLTAAIRIGWHLPLMFYGDIYWTDIATMLAAQLIYVWFYLRTGRSVLPLMLLHLMNNTVSGDFVTRWFTGADWVRFYWLLAAVWCAVAALILLVSKINGSRPTMATDGDAVLPEHAVPAA
jgi:hypothetical protein